MFDEREPDFDFPVDRLVSDQTANSLETAVEDLVEEYDFHEYDGFDDENNDSSQDEGEIIHNQEEFSNFSKENSTSFVEAFDNANEGLHSQNIVNVNYKDRIVDLSSLNKSQKEAVLTEAQQTLVLAGAGTGKTRVIIKRIETILKSGTPINKIVATTFTNKAAAELRHRLSQLIGPEANSLICGTFHRISAQFLRVYGEKIGLLQNFQLITDDDQLRLIKRILKVIDPNKEKTARNILEYISRFKETGKKPYEKLFDLAYEMYQKELTTNSYLDYSDLIQYAINLFEMCPDIASSLADHILVDEYQDINQMQYRWIKLLSKDKHLFCVGDEDQAIYAFRGASVQYIQKFHQDFSTASIIQLEENYRSAPEILKGAVHLISKNEKQFEKNLIATDACKEGFIRIHKSYNEYEEAILITNLIAQWNQKKEGIQIAILVRTNMQIHCIEHALVEAQIAYSISSGKKFYMRKEIQDLIAYLRVLVFENDFLAFSRILNTPKRNMGDARLDMLLDAMKSFDCSFENALNILLHQLPRNASEKCSLLLMQIQHWRSLKSSLRLDLLADKILQDINYKELEEMSDTAMQAIESLKEHMKNAKSLEEFLENLQFLDSQEDGTNVQIMTMHAAKGLEFDIVIAPGWEENMFPSPMANNKQEIEEERRLAYVTITRAKSYLEIIHTCSRRINGRYQNQMPSRFLFDLR